MKWKADEEHLSNRIFRLFFILFIIFMLVSLIGIQLIMSIYNKKLYDKSLQELEFYANQFEEELEEVEQISYDIALDYSIQEQLSFITSLTDKDEILYYSDEFRTRLFNESLNQDIITSIIYTDNEYLDFRFGDLYIQIPEEIKKQLMEKIMEGDGKYVYLDPTTDFPYVASGRKIRKYLDDSLDFMGVLMIISDVEPMIQKTYSYISEPYPYLHIRNGTTTVYEKNEVGDIDLPESLNDNGFKIISEGGHRYFMSYMYSEKTHWQYISMYPYSSIFNVVTTIRWSLIIGGLLLLALAFISVKKLSEYISTPVVTLSEIMQIVEQGELEEAKNRLSILHYQNEVGVLTRNFHSMVKRLMWLIHENYEKQILLKDTQYKALQSQINPHFLYNTLNLISWMVKADRGKDAIKVSVAIGDFLRLSINQGPYTRVDDELRMIKNYIDIQKLRYQKRIEFSIDNQMVNGDYEIPSMMIQPLIENAINHGTSQVLKLCHIQVQVIESEDTISIRVSDDGRGMSPDVLDKVRRVEIENRASGIGLKNIYERLTLLYGEQFEFDVDSEEGVGTTFMVSIPKEKRNVSNDDC